MSDARIDFYGSLIVLPAVVVFGVALSIYEGWALWTLWGWFVVPLGIKPITIPWAIGLMALITLTRKPSTYRKENRSPDFMKIILTPIVAVCIGQVANQWM